MLISGVLVSLLMIFSTQNETLANEPKLSDVENHWAQKEIEELVQRNIIGGYNDKSFRPNNKITRAEVATVLTRVHDYKNASSSFKDVKKDDWFYEAISKALDAGIVSGYPDGTFQPNKNIQRQDIAVMLTRVMTKNGTFDKKAALSFIDNSEISSYAKDSLRTMVHYGLMNGRTKDKISPKGEATRAEVVVMVYRMIQLLENAPVEPDPQPEPKPEEPQPEEPEPNEPTDKHYSEMTLDELKAAYGTRILIERIDGYAPGVGIIKRDLMDDYYEELHEYKWDVGDPVTYMKDLEKQLMNLSGHYATWYPKYEIISYRGKSYKDSVLYEPAGIYNFNSLKFHDLSILPSNPTIEGNRLIDLHTYSDGFAVYDYNNTDVGYLEEIMYKKNDVWMVDSVNLFGHFGAVKENGNEVTMTRDNKQVKVQVGKKTAEVNGVEKSLSVSVEEKNGVIFVPMREVASLLDLHTKAYLRGVGRIEVANYPLGEDYQ